MTGNEIIKYLEEWAPKEISWQKDNAGLQVGTGSAEIKNILLALDATEEVIDDALDKDCNFIITHHPLLFYPLKKINTDDGSTSALAARLIKNDITLYSAHTNLDYTKEGVSFSLAKALNLHNVTFLSRLKLNQYKFTVFVPAADADKVADAIFNAGGGNIGEYSRCSFRTAGTGTSEGSDESDPAIGEKGKFTTIKEVKIEVIIDAWILNKVIAAVNEVHPYEEPAFDLIPLHNAATRYGAGAVGMLARPMPADKFLEHIAKKLNAQSLKFSEPRGGKISKVAVCGGSGSEYLADAINAGADAFITADVKYHTFQDARNKILLIDAGHYETEIFSLDELQRRLKAFIKADKIKVIKFSGSSNPVNIYNN